MDNQININEVQMKFFYEHKEYDAEVIITINSKDKYLRQLLLNSIFVDHQNNSLYYEATPQDPDSLSFYRRILVKYHKTLNI